MNEGTRAQYDANIRAILKNWTVATYQDAFPESIRPTSLGTSAITILKGISSKKTLTDAQALFIRECKDSQGAPIKAGFVIIQKIWKNLQETETANASAQKSNQGSSGRKTKPKRRSTGTPTKNVGTPKVSSY